MAVNLCNSLTRKNCEVHLCATRVGGPLEEFIDPSVRMIELRKKHSLDLKAFLRLLNYVRSEGIQIVHAHSSSFFWGSLLKKLTKVRLVWHDHYGDSEHLNARKKRTLLLLSKSFDHVYSVNKLLQAWAIESLKLSRGRVEYLPNFPSLPLSEARSVGRSVEPQNVLACVARIHPQKDHVTLLKAIGLVRNAFPDVKLNLIGQYQEDDYYNELREIIASEGLEDCVSFLGGRSDIASLLAECKIGILSSESEGLPVSLLEYGLVGLPVVCTRVGQCAEVLGDGEFGNLVEAGDSQRMAEALIFLLANDEKRLELGEKFKFHVNAKYSEIAIAERVRKKYRDVLGNE